MFDVVQGLKDVLNRLKNEVDYVIESGSVTIGDCRLTVKVEVWEGRMLVYQTGRGNVTTAAAYRGSITGSYHTNIQPGCSWRLRHALLMRSGAPERHGGI